MSYDQKCEELARYFLEDKKLAGAEYIEHDVKEMAQAIQDTVEALLEDTK